ncbi:MAG: hypothetical protein WCG80_17185 [Spirochaetales bacterium]
MDASAVALAAFLDTLDRFSLPQGVLGPGALTELALGCQLWSFRAGDVIAFPDEKPEGTLIVAEGCLVLQTRTGGDVYLGVREELDPALPGLWRGQTDGQYVVLPDATWQHWLRIHPAAAQAWGVQPGLELPSSLARTPLLLAAGEGVQHVFRRSPLFWLKRVLLPGALFVILAVFCALIPFPLAIFPLAGALMAGFLVLLFTWEWRVSTLALTDRAVLLRQVDAWERRSDFEKLSLDTLKEATYRKQGLVDSLFGLVAVELEGDSPKGKLVFEGLRADAGFAEAVNTLKVQRSRQKPTRRAIRAALASRSGGAREPVLLLRPAEKRESTGRRLSWRKEKNGLVTFRRHPWHLGRKLLPWLGWTALVVALVGFAAALAGSAAPAVLLAGALTLLPLSRAVYEFADWSNDNLVLQGDKVVCVHRKPMWGGEIRQEGFLADVQQIGVRKESLFALLLDFGTLTVSFGGSSPLVFENASHPEWVQNEIFARRGQVQADQERTEAASRLDQMTEILDAWEEAKEAGYFPGKS